MARRNERPHPACGVLDREGQLPGYGSRLGRRLIGLIVEIGQALLDFLITETGHHELGSDGFSRFRGFGQAWVVVLALGQRNVVVSGNHHCKIRKTFPEGSSYVRYVAGVEGRDECYLEFLR